MRAAIQNAGIVHPETIAEWTEIISHLDGLYLEMKSAEQAEESS